MGNELKKVVRAAIYDPGGSSNVFAAVSSGLPALYDIASPTGCLSTQSVQYVGTPAAYYVVRTPNKFKFASCTTAAATDLWTPAGGKKFRIMGGVIIWAAGLLAAGLEAVDLQQETLGSVGIKFQSYLPAAASILGVGTVCPFTLGPNGYLATVADKKLQVVMTSDCTVGAVSVTVWGTEE